MGVLTLEVNRKNRGALCGRGPAVREVVHRSQAAQRGARSRKTELSLMDRNMPATWGEGESSRWTGLSTGKFYAGNEQAPSFL